MLVSRLPRLSPTVNSLCTSLFDTVSKTVLEKVTIDLYNFKAHICFAGTNLQTEGQTYLP